ncbi:ribonuclease Z [Candidatus Woesearchaeota archaeon]|nr:ribonuclease Z [Candidatus Woesearchaeota archaeon]
MEITFLGTSSMVPTKDRNHAGVFVTHGSEGILFDCGEGTQRQLKIAGIPLTRITKILITHWHGDHVLGLPGLVQSLGSMNYDKRLCIYGPKGTKKRLALLKKAFVFEEKVELDVFDIKKEIFYEDALLSLQALLLEHTTDCLGFSIIEHEKRKIDMNAAKRLGLSEGPLIGKLQEGSNVKINNKVISPDEVSHIEKGMKISYVTDTALCNNAVKLAKDSDILICESTYADDLEEKAEKYKHMTSRHAGMLANKANVNQLILTHFSQRYKDIHQIAEDAKTVFSNVTCAYDFMKVKL